MDYRIGDVVTSRETGIAYRIAGISRDRTGAVLRLMCYRVSQGIEFRCDFYTSEVRTEQGAFSREGGI